jgi:hypothetical protein
LILLHLNFRRDPSGCWFDWLFWFILDVEVKVIVITDSCPKVSLFFNDLELFLSYLLHHAVVGGGSLLLEGLD